MMIKLIKGPNPVVAWAIATSNDAPGPDADIRHV